MRHKSKLASLCVIFQLKMRYGEDKKSSPRGARTSRETSSWLAIAGRRPPSWSLHRRVTHNLAVLTHNLAQKTGKEPWQTCETSHLFPTRSYASQSLLGEVMVHNPLNSIVYIILNFGPLRIGLWRLYASLQANLWVKRQSAVAFFVHCRHFSPIICRSAKRGMRTSNCFVW